MVKGQKTLTAYPLEDQPLGSSLPYVPQARPWDARAIHAPGEGRDPSSRLEVTVGKSEIEKLAAAAASGKGNATAGMRPTASVTDIPGAAAPAKRLEGKASFKAPGKPIKSGAHQRVQIQDGDQVFLDSQANVQHFTFPAILWFVVGVICPPFLCCGLRFTSSANAVAKFFGWASLFLFSVYVAGGMILFAQFYFKAGAGTDKNCLRYIQGLNDWTLNEYGKANPVLGIVAPGLTITTNISIMEVNCSFVAQMEIEGDSISRLDRTLVVRIHTPGTNGDNFGLYVRDRGTKINPSIDPAPAKAWFEFARPELSNPQPSGKRGKCNRGMCDGVYGNSLPSLAGSMYEARVPLGWFKYFVAIGVVANDVLALERPFCMESCLLTNIPSPPEKIPKTSTDPCEGQEISACPAATAQCVFAKTREDCLGVLGRRKATEEETAKERARGRMNNRREFGTPGMELVDSIHLK